MRLAKGEKVCYSIVTKKKCNSKSSNNQRYLKMKDPTFMSNPLKGTEEKKK